MWFLRILRYVTFVDLSDAGGCAFLSFCTYSWVFHLFKKRRVRKDRNSGNVGHTSTADGERDVNQKKLNWPFQIFSCDVPFLLRFRARKNYSNRQESFEESKLFFNDESKWKWNTFAEEYFVHRLKFDGKWKETFDSHFIPIVHQRIFFDQGNLLSF